MTQPTMMGGEAVTTETQIDRDARHAAMLRMGAPRARIETRIEDAGAYMTPVHEAIVPVLADTKYVTPQVDPPRVVARDRAIPLALVVGLISLTGGGLAAVLPIDREWLPAIGFVFAAINAAAAYYLRAVGEGDKDQSRAERV